MCAFNSFDETHFESFQRRREKILLPR